jgi:hypothetical protein
MGDFFGCFDLGSHTIMVGRVKLPLVCWNLFCLRCDVLPPLITLCTILRGMAYGDIRLREPTRNELVEALHSSNTATKKSPKVSPHLKEWVSKNFLVSWPMLKEYQVTNHFRRSIF